MSNKSIEAILHLQIDWESSTESPYTFQTEYKGMSIQLRLNDFPDEPLCTLITEGNKMDLDEFPSFWTLPHHREK